MFGFNDFNNPKEMNMKATKECKCHNHNHNVAFMPMDGQMPMMDAPMMMDGCCEKGCMERPVCERPIERCVQRCIVHECPHVIPVRTKIINNHIYKHTYCPQFSCCEENRVCHINENPCC